MQSSGNRRFHHYEVVCRPDGTPWELGRGAMGVTYKAFDRNLRCHVALKVIHADLLQDPNGQERLLREARAAAQLRHPNVAAIYHLGHEEGQGYFYTMELVDGETFHEVIRRQGPLEAAEAVRLLLPVARALVAAHAQNLIHRDLKPSNLMLVRAADDEESLVKVIDFGLAKIIVPPGENPGAGGASAGSAPLPSHSLTQAGHFVGTPHYASPEQLEGLPTDTRADIYSVGVTLWYLLAGRPPFDGPSLMRIASEHLFRPPPFEQLPGHTPAAVSALLGRLLAKDPAARPQTPAALRAELLACLRQLTAPELAATADGGAAARTGPAAPSSRETAGADARPGAPPPARRSPGATTVGDVLAERYLLFRRDGADGYQTIDLEAGETVSVRFLPAGLGPDDVRRLQAAAARLAAAPHPHLRRIRAFRPADAAGDRPVLVSEWIDGVTLLELLRQRGALSLPETLGVLGPLAAAVDALPELGAGDRSALDLRRILLAAPRQEGPGGPGGPEEVLKFDAADCFLEAAPSGAGDQTMAPVLPAPPTRFHPAVTLGRLTRELLGGGGRAPAAAWSPLPSLNEEGNAVLRRCLEGSGEDGGYRDAGEFVAALRQATGSPARFPVLPAPPPARDGVPPLSLDVTREFVLPGFSPPPPPGSSHPAGPAPPTARPPAVVPAAPAAPARTATAGVAPGSSVRAAVPPVRGPAARRGLPGGLLLFFLVVLGAAGVGVVWYLRGVSPAARETAGREEKSGGPPAAGGERPPPAAGPAKPRAGSFPRAGQPWENSLGLRLVPVGNFLAAVWPTRVADFRAFVGATGYDATGGMYSLGADGRRRELGRTWSEPGFAQEPTGPVVGVNCADAEAFCAWLTKSEREAGWLPAAGWRYRLPTDAEWSRLAGLGAESGDTPEQRGARAPEIFPWGRAWPPPSSGPPPGNYAGEEAGLPAVSTLAGYRDGFPRTAPVGSFPPNALGVCDAGGNVWQWCADPFKPGANWRVLRGGSWLCADRRQLRLGARDNANPEFRHDDVGFRVVLVPGP